MQISKITPNTNYNLKNNQAKNKAGVKTNSISTNSYAKVQSPMFCGLLANLDRLKEQHKITNKAYRVFGESVKALNEANYEKQVALGSAEIAKNSNYTNLKYSAGTKQIILDEYITHTDENNNIILDTIIDRNIKTNAIKVTKFNDDGTIAQIAKKCTLDEDNNITKADEIYTFLNGKLDSYVKGYLVNDLDETIEIDAEYNYENDEISSFSKKVVIDSETSEINAEETFSYEYSQLTEYAQNVHFYPLNDNVEALKHYVFLNDKLISVHKNYSAYNNPND